MQQAWVQSLVRELDATCYNKKWKIPCAATKIRCS